MYRPRMFETMDLRKFGKKNHILNCPTIIDNILLVVENSEIDHSYIRFYSGFLFDICEITPW